MSTALFRSRYLALLLVALLGPLAFPGLGQEVGKKAEGKKVDEKKGDDKKAEPAAEVKGRKYALIVGARLYKREELRPLRYAARDAAALAEALKGAGYRRVVLMTYDSAAEDADLLPTARNIKAQLEGLLEDRRRDDSVLVAFFCHGAEFEGSKDYFLCPIDAELGSKDTLLSLNEVYRDLAKSKAGHKLVLLDACYARPSANPDVKLALRPRPQELPVPKGVQALFGCSAGQLTFDSDRLEQGIFPHFLLKGLAGEAGGKDGPVTLDALVRYVRDEVPDAALVAGGPTARQRPQLLGAEDTKLVLVPRPVSLVAAPPKDDGKGALQSDKGSLNARVQNQEGIINFPIPYAAPPKVTFSNTYFGLVEVTAKHFRWRHLDNTPSSGNWTAVGRRAAGFGPVLEHAGMLSARVFGEEGVVRFPSRFGRAPSVSFNNSYFTLVEVTPLQFRWRHVDNTPSAATWTARGSAPKR